MQRILILTAFAFIGFHAIAQVQRKVAATDTPGRAAANNGKDTTAESDKKTNLRKLLKELNLTNDQQVRLKEILLNNKAKRDEIGNDAALTEGQKQDKLKTMRKAAAYNLQEILTDEQKAKLKAMRREKRNDNRNNTGDK